MLKRGYLIASAQLQFTKPPAALAFMAGVCEVAGVDYRIADLNLELLKHFGPLGWTEYYKYAETDYNHWDAAHQKKVDVVISKLVNEIVKFNPEFVAITVLSYMQHEWTLIILDAIKKALPNLKIISGGPGISVSGAKRQPGSSFGKILASMGLTDYYVLGEGELLFLDFLHERFNKPGLNTASSDEVWQEQITDLNLLPTPSYKKIPITEYPADNKKAKIIITGSRGCVRKCTFCDVAKFWPKFRFKAATTIVNEIVQYHLETGVTNYWFSDALINGSISQFKEFLLGIIKAKELHPSLKDLELSGNFIIRPQKDHPEEMFKLMHEAGFKRLDNGIETGSDAVRFHMGKKFTNEDIDYHFSMSEKYQISNWMLLVVGYPTETNEDFQSTLDMIKRYQKYQLNDTLIGVSITGLTNIFPSTPLWSQINELEIEFHHSNHKFHNWKNTKSNLGIRVSRLITLIRLCCELGVRMTGEVVYVLNAERQNLLDEITDIKSKQYKKVFSVLKVN